MNMTTLNLLILDESQPTYPRFVCDHFRRYQPKQLNQHSSKPQQSPSERRGFLRNLGLTCLDLLGTRFLREAQATHLNISVEIEFLANYLTELTLMEYELLKFLPWMIAASAVFVAKWTMNQSNHPWNETLEHYTKYKACDLKATLKALQELQVNTKGCPLNSIRNKYVGTWIHMA
ncbi:unnamed protein product [Cochlearia groenlandica]